MSVKHTELMCTLHEPAASTAPGNDRNVAPRPTPGRICILTSSGDMQLDWSLGSTDGKRSNKRPSSKMSLYERYKETHLVQRNGGFKLHFKRLFFKGNHSYQRMKGGRGLRSELWERTRPTALAATGILNITSSLNLKVATQYSLWEVVYFMLMTYKRY